MAKYILKETGLTPRMRNKKGIVVALSEKPIDLKVDSSLKYPDGIRTIPAATQEDLKYFYDDLGAKKYIIKIEDEKKEDDSKLLNATKK